MANASAAALDFTNVKEGGGSFNKRRMPEGDYKAKVTKVQDAPSKKDGVAQWLFTIDVDGGGTYPYYCKHQENQLWKIRNLLVAAGISVPKKRVKVDPNKVVGKTIGVTLEDDEYEGKAQSNIAAVFPASELDGDDDDEDEVDDEEVEDEEVADTEEDDEEEDEEPEPPKKKKKAAPAPAEEEDDEDELEEIDIEDV